MCPTLSCTVHMMNKSSWNNHKASWIWTIPPLYVWCKAFLSFLCFRCQIVYLYWWLLTWSNCVSSSGWCYSILYSYQTWHCLLCESAMSASPFFTTLHWTTTKRVLRYSKGTPHHGLSFAKGSHRLHAFCDSDLVGNLDDHISITGFGAYFSSCLISWCSKKQPVVSQSSTEA